VTTQNPIALSLRKQSNEPFTPDETRLADDLGAILVDLRQHGIKLVVNDVNKNDFIMEMSEEPADLEGGTHFPVPNPNSDRIDGESE
jgi:hypothetical protein